MRPGVHTQQPHEQQPVGTRLRDAGIDARGLSTSSFRITWMVPNGDVEHAVRALHACFVKPHLPPTPPVSLETPN